MTFLDLIEWSNNREEDREQDESVGHSENNDSKPHSEEHREDVRLTTRENHDGKEGRECAVENWWAHCSNSSSGFEDTLFLVGEGLAVVGGIWWVDGQVSMADVSAVVHSESDGDYTIDDGYTVQSDSPEIKKGKQEKIDQAHTQ